MGGGARTLSLGCARGGVGCVVRLVVGAIGRVGAGRVVILVGGTGARVGACILGRGAADTLCDRSHKAALIGASVSSSTGQVGRVGTWAWMLPNWVVMVSS